jgi:hypothetical protein
MPDITSKKLKIKIPIPLLKTFETLLENHKLKSPIRYGSNLITGDQLSITAGDFIDLFSFITLNSEEQFSILRIKQFGVTALKEKIRTTRSESYQSHLKFCLECLEGRS